MGSDGTRFGTVRKDSHGLKHEGTRRQSRGR